MTTIDDLSDRYLAAYAALDPCLATTLGVSGHDAELTGYSPDAYTAIDDLNRRTRTELDALPAGQDPVAVRVLREHLDDHIELAAHGVPMSSITSPVQDLRRSIELLLAGDATPHEAVRARLAAMPAALAGLRASLERDRERGPAAARRQVLLIADECDMTARYLTALGPGLDAYTGPAAAAFTDTGHYLRRDLAPHATERDAVGADRYTLGARYYTGTTLDLAETYEWGWAELGRIEDGMRRAAAELMPGEPVAAVTAELDATRRITGADAFRGYLQELADRAIDDLHGTHFDIPEALRRVDCRIPDTGAGGTYYLPPSEDLTRPGTVWWTVTGDSTAIWTVPATMYHEGVPGHHLQQGSSVLAAGRLNAFRRAITEWGHSGHVEGWGLYAETLMGELGYFDDPAHRLGMLAGGQQMRAARVVLDIGLHLELPIPKGAGFHEGETWNRDLALEFLSLHYGADEPESVRFEIDRYLGTPGQAVAYKVGERAWLAIREQARRRPGFDLTTFHRNALAHGSMGLDAFAAAMTPTPA